MERLPELSGLSHADKDQLIRFLRESLGELREELSELSYIIKVVQSKLVQEGLFGSLPLECCSSENREQ